MAASYPGAIKSFSAVVNGVTKLVASLFNSPYDEITALETELGTDVAGSKSDLKARLTVSLEDDGTLKAVASSPYIQGPGDGYKTVMGTVSVPTGAPTAISFGITFNAAPNLQLAIEWTGGGVWTAAITLTAISTTGATLRHDGGATCTIHWVATGVPA